MYAILFASFSVAGAAILGADIALQAATTTSCVGYNDDTCLPETSISETSPTSYITLSSTSTTFIGITTVSPLNSISSIVSESSFYPEDCTHLTHTHTSDAPNAPPTPATTSSSLVSSTPSIDTGIYPTGPGPASSDTSSIFPTASTSTVSCTLVTVSVGGPPLMSSTPGPLSISCTTIYGVGYPSGPDDFTVSTTSVSTPTSTSIATHPTSHSSTKATSSSPSAYPTESSGPTGTNSGDYHGIGSRNTGHWWMTLMVSTLFSVGIIQYVFL